MGIKCKPLRAVAGKEPLNGLGRLKTEFGECLEVRRGRRHDEVSTMIGVENYTASENMEAVND